MSKISKGIRKNNQCVALYCRSATQENTEWITEQLEQLTHYASNHFGSDTQCVYTERGKDGLTRQRPQLNKLFNDVRKGRIKVILAVDRARFARDEKVLDNIERDFAKYGIPVFYVTRAVQRKR